MKLTGRRRARSYSGRALRYFQVLDQNMFGFLGVAFTPLATLTWTAERLHHYFEHVDFCISIRLHYIEDRLYRMGE